MKSIFAAIAIVLALSSCSKKGSSSLEELGSTIETAIRNNQPSQMADTMYLEGADPEVRKTVSEMFEMFAFSGLEHVDIQTVDFDDLKPEVDLPGQLHGRPLKWLHQPTHWIVVKASSKGEPGNQTKLNLELAAGQVDGKWYLMGCTYAGKAPEKVSVPGLTDRDATAIAFDKKGEVVDFITIPPDTDMQEIVFKAPENGDEISVTVVGPSRHADITEDFVISSSKAEGMRGSVSVYVEDGIVTGIFGNGISQGSPLDESDLKGVLEKIQSGSHVPSERVEIIRK